MEREGGAIRWFASVLGRIWSHFPPAEEGLALFATIDDTRVRIGCLAFSFTLVCFLYPRTKCEESDIQVGTITSGDQRRRLLRQASQSVRG